MGIITSTVLVTCLIGNTIMSSHIIAEPVTDGVDLHVTNILGYELDGKICTFTIDGKAFTVLWNSNPGKKADDITITTPENYIAIPSYKIIPDNTDTKILIRKILLG